MFRTLALILLVSLNTNTAYAQSNEVDAEEMEALKLLANKICSSINSVSDSTDANIIEQVNGYITHYLGLEEGEQNTTEIYSFWITNSQYLICDIESVEAGRDIEHVLKRAIAMHYHKQFFYEYLFKAGSGEIFNTTELVDGKEETLLDYIDKLMGEEDFEFNYNPAEMKRLRNILVKNFGAKTAEQLRQEN